jgi:hypothetical protein
MFIDEQRKKEGKKERLPTTGSDFLQIKQHTLSVFIQII